MIYDNPKKYCFEIWYIIQFFTCIISSSLIDTYYIYTHIYNIFSDYFFVYPILFIHFGCTCFWILTHMLTNFFSFMHYLNCITLSIFFVPMTILIVELLSVCSVVSRSMIWCFACIHVPSSQYVLTFQSYWFSGLCNNIYVYK